MEHEKNNHDMIHHLPRLKWACRRGMLELDVLLGNFLDKAYTALPDEEKVLFVKLLDSPDPELFNWLMGKGMPADPELGRIVEIIRNHARSRI